MQESYLYDDARKSNDESWNMIMLEMIAGRVSATPPRRELRGGRTDRDKKNSFLLL